MARARAPTITIDTSAASPSPEEPSPEHNTLNSPEGLLSVPTGNASRRSFDSGSNTLFASTDRRSSFESSTDFINDEEALKPEAGTEADFEVENNKFAFSPGQLTRLFQPSKSYAAFYALGGGAGIVKGLRTDAAAGLSVDEGALDGQVTFEDVQSHAAVRTAHDETAEKLPPVELAETTEQATPQKTNESSRTEAYTDRRRVFSDNRLPERKSKSIFQLMWQAYKDKVLLLLTAAAVVSLAIGIYQATQPNGDPEWIEGVAIIVAIVIVVMVGAANDWQKERQFVKLNKKKDNRLVKVVRSGRIRQVSVFDIFAGDIALLEQGDIVPVDGIFLEGHNLSCDESSATGESDLLKKTPAADVYKALEEHRSIRKLDPFILSGSKVSEGVGRFVITGTGVHSSYGKMMLSLRDEGEVTPLQSKLNILAEYIAKLGGAAALLYFVVTFIEFLVSITRGSEQSLSPAQKGQNFLNIFVIAVSVIVVAVPEGLPLAVTLALAFATTRMLKDHNLVRLLRSCETMGNATTVCSDKTGTLTQNVMTVVAGAVGTTSRFGDYKGLEQKRSSKAESTAKSGDVSAQEFVATLPTAVKELLLQSIAINTTAFENEEGEFVGSKTETAMLQFARDYLGMQSASTERSNSNIVQLIPFDSSRKNMAVVVKLNAGGYRMYIKGAPEIILQQCSSIIDTERLAKDTLPESALPTRILEDPTELERIIDSYASRSLRTIGIAYRDFDDQNWPPRSVRRSEDGQAAFNDLNHNLTFLSAVGIQDPLRPGVADAVKDCRRAGVFVRMVTGDNKKTAMAIAKECGILTEEGVALEGPEFRKMSRPELDAVLPRLQVLARSSPEDKRKLARRLKDLGGVVAVTGDGTNDAPALKTADVGFSMGIAGTEVAKEASAIILMDDNFSSIVKALMWGRAVNDAVKKFLQFQVTVNITAVVVTFISGVASNNNNPVLTAVQLLWVNLIMDTFAALALATDPPPRSILDRPPDKRTDGLISLTMWKMIIGQAIYQLVVTIVLFFRGADILSYQSQHEQDQLRTLIFNTFVWMQIFNTLNSRRLDNHFNVFEGIFRNYLFIIMVSIMCGGQVLIVFVGGEALSTVRLNGAQWGYSIVLGFLSVPIGVIVRLVPDELIRACIPEFLKRRANAIAAQADSEAQKYEWNQGVADVRDQLLFLKKFKGGRLNNLRFKIHKLRDQTPRPSSNRSRSSTQTSLAAGIASAGIVAGSIAGWSPVERKDRRDSDPFPRSEKVAQK